MPGSEISANYPISLSDLPATLQQRWLVLVVAILLLVGLVIVAPFANVPIGPFPAAVIAQQAIVFVNDFITAILLFAQYSIVRSRGVMALAGGYLFTALIVIAHGLTFPNAFTPNGLLGAGLQSTAWLYFFWHWAPPLSILVYAWLKDVTGARSMNQSSAAAIAWCVVVVLGLVGGLTWLATGGERFLPIIFADRTEAAPGRLEILTTLTFVIAATSLALLLLRRSLVLDYWLMLVLWTLMLEQTLVGIFTDTRYSVGFYAGRGFSLLTSVFVLGLLLQGVVRLHARLARSNVVLRRAQNSKLMNLEAMAASISHEVRQPLAAIVSNGSAALRFLDHTPPNVEEVRMALMRLLNDSRRVEQVFESLRGLFVKPDQENERADLNEVAREALRIFRDQLRNHRIVTRTHLTSELLPVMGNKGQLQEVITNLIQNAIDAMDVVKEDRRVLQLKTSLDMDSILLTVEDSGPGIDPNKTNSVFDAFVTTKRDGMGLGLAICRMIVERHGGKIFLEPADPNGCVFRIILPIGTPGLRKAEQDIYQPLGE